MLIIDENGMSPDYWDFVAHQNTDKKVVFRRENANVIDTHKVRNFFIPHGFTFFPPNSKHILIGQCHVVGGKPFGFVEVYLVTDEGPLLQGRYRKCSVSDILSANPWIEKNRNYLPWKFKDSMHDVLRFNDMDVEDVCLQNGIVNASQFDCFVLYEKNFSLAYYLLDRVKNPFHSKREWNWVTSVQINHSNLKDTQICQVLTPHECFMHHYNLILQMQEPKMVEVSNQSKIVKAGFDTKQSFRHRK